MARPIQRTPVIKGEDAKRFRKELMKSLNKDLTIEEKAKKEEELKKMEESYNLLTAISDGKFY